jgi:hypothetical protein
MRRNHRLIWLEMLLLGGWAIALLAPLLKT